MPEALIMPAPTMLTLQTFVSTLRWSKPIDSCSSESREGRSTEGFPNPVHGIYLTEENYVYGDLCLNAEGMVLSNGDLSYARQREHALCPCGKLMQYLRMTLKKRQKERLYE